jgi:hypothetical protein
MVWASPPSAAALFVLRIEPRIARVSTLRAAIADAG